MLTDCWMILPSILEGIGNARIRPSALDLALSIAFTFSNLAQTRSFLALYSHPARLKMTVVTEKGNISKELYEFVLLIDGQGMREEAWILRCCACLAMNDIKAKVDLIGLTFDDLTYNLDCEDEGLTLSGGQRSWVRRCIDKANKEFVANVAERGEAEPARGEASAIKAFVETIKNEEVCQDLLSAQPFLVC